MCFFGAAWQNRRVPHSISAEVVKRLQSVTGNNVTVILQPDDAVEPWQKLSVCAGGKIVLLQADVCKVAERVVAADVVVSTDSSWLHIAHMYGVPTVGLYGFTNAAEWAPPGCSVVYSDIVFPSKEMHDLSKEAICPLDSLNPDAVVTAALVLLKTSQNC